ncbi:hypothetical protein BV898_10775 [Hypsibius exemplaris]|uniref:Endonuclease/exonuclease/phosphatase domain-containing protein n=1 Tax=Hypsibius exemplaris TaxID=2072580 RepID=A0A1W0WIG9_HYPEX|nr:hypothetical protein BV898_10775 [Hypsibius exemplaris]
MSALTPREGDLLDVAKEFTLFQIFRGKTRCRGGRTSCLDLIFTSQKSLIEKAVAILPPSATNDHFGLQFHTTLWTQLFPSLPKSVWICPRSKRHYSGMN